MKLSFEVALTLLREGDSQWMRQLYPDLSLVFDLIDKQNKMIIELEEQVWDQHTQN